MKKLNNKHLKQIKAGKLSGALFNGISGCIKSIFTGIVDITNSVCGWVMGFKEAGKSHDKMSLKVGNSSVSYDDTNSVKAEHEVEMQYIKLGKAAESKPEKVSYETVKETHDNGNSQNHITHHSNDFNDVVHTDMHVVDDFIHF